MRPFVKGFSVSGVDYLRYYEGMIAPFGWGCSIYTFYDVNV